MKHSHRKWDKLGAKKVSRVSTMKPVASIKVVISGHCYSCGILTVVSTLLHFEKIKNGKKIF